MLCSKRSLHGAYIHHRLLPRLRGITEIRHVVNNNFTVNFIYHRKSGSEGAGL